MKTRMTVVLAGAALAALSGIASANGHVNFGISIGVPAYVAPAPAYYLPPPVTYAPPPITYAPPPVYYAPPAVYYVAPRAYYAPVPWAAGYYRGGYGGHGHWNGRHW